MKKIILSFALCCGALSCGAVRIEYDDKNQIILNKEVCALAQESINSAVYDLANTTSAADRKKAQTKIFVMQDLLKRCIDAGYLNK